MKITIKILAVNVTYEGKWYNQIDAWDACAADETMLNTPDA